MTNYAQGGPVWGEPPKVPDAVREALVHAEKTCRYHGRQFGASGWWRGVPRCDSCQQPWRVTQALASIGIAVLDPDEKILTAEQVRGWRCDNADLLTALNAAAQ